jgi:hypothetical protein
MYYPTKFESFNELKNSILNDKNILATQFNQIDCETINFEQVNENSKDEQDNDFNYILLYQLEDKYIVEIGIIIRELANCNSDDKTEKYYAKLYETIESDTIDNALDFFHELKNLNDRLEHNYFAIKKQHGACPEDYTIENDEDSEYIYFQGYIYTLDEDVVYSSSIKLDAYKNIIKIFTKILDK